MESASGVKRRDKRKDRRRTFRSSPVMAYQSSEGAPKLWHTLTGYPNPALQESRATGVSVGALGADKFAIESRDVGDGNTLRAL